MSEDQEPTYIDQPRQYYKCLICGKVSYVISYSGHKRRRMGVCGREECYEARIEQLIVQAERGDLYARGIRELAKMVDGEMEELQKSLAALQLAGEFYGGKKEE